MCSAGKEDEALVQPGGGSPPAAYLSLCDGFTQPGSQMLLLPEAPAGLKFLSLKFVHLRVYD